MVSLAQVSLELYTSYQRLPNREMASSTLLRNGKLLLHGRDDHITTTDADLLIIGNKITKIGPNIDVDEQTCIIDCTDKIISPGFIDTRKLHLASSGCMI